MAKYIIMPKLGFNMDQGTVVRWLKKEGDTIKEREEILEIETDNTIMPIEAPWSGILRKILVREGETIAVALPIGIIAEEKEDIQPLIEEADRRLEKKINLLLLQKRRRLTKRLSWPKPIQPLIRRFLPVLNVKRKNLA